MVKIFLFMYLCSSIAGTDCKVVPTPVMMFNDMYDCTKYGYNYSYKMLSSFDREWVNSMGAHFRFMCEPKEII
jgi:hypothetical protein